MSPDSAQSATMGRMDRIDRQIVHCLQRDGRAGFRRIAEVLAVSEQTVARRYRALHHAGALRVLALGDAGASGGQTWFARILCRPDAAESLAQALATREDVSWVSITSGGGEVTFVTRSDPASGQSSVLLERLPRSQQVLSFTAYCVLHMHVGGEAEWLAFDDPLSDEQISLLHKGSRPVRDQAPTVVGADDAPLLAALAQDGRAGVVELARTTGWPQSRVSARLDELLATGTVHVEVDLAPSMFGFQSAAYLWLTVAPGELHATGQALSLHPETSFAAAVTGAANLMTVVTCRDADALYSYVTTKVGALPAVRQAEIVPVLRRVKQAGTRIRNGRLELTPAQ
jgi:DNA-binding Lrp family transcriptional regulator